MVCQPWVSWFLLLAAVVAAVSMLTLMGRKEWSVGPKKLRAAHIVAGWITVALAVYQSALCVRHVAFVGDGMSVRGALHGLVALFLLSVMLLKLAFVKRYRQYVKLVPTLGMAVFALLLVVIATSAGFHYARAWWGPGAPATAVGEERTDEASADASVSSESLEGGRLLYEMHCAGCHPTDPERGGYGPTLPGLFGRETLAATGEPVTEENVRGQILRPAGRMPAFEGRLDDRELSNLIAYMRTL